MDIFNILSISGTNSSVKDHKLHGLERSEQDVRRASVIAGIGYLVIAVLAIFANFVGPGSLVTQGDATQIVTTIRDSEGVFCLSIATCSSRPSST